MPSPKLAAVLVALVALCSSLVLPADARSTFVQDDAQLFSSATVSSLNSTIGDFNRQTGKEVVVVTVPSLDGATPQAAAEKAFAQQQVNGVLVFLSKAEKKQGIIPDRVASAFFPSGEIDSIRQAMRGYFRTGDYDTGITTGVNLILDQYRSHEGALRGAPVQHQQFAPSTTTQSFGGGMSLLWLILILVAGFLIIRAIFRAIAGPRRMPPGYGGGPGYGGPGYGGGYGGGGGGGFFSGLLGGLGGAFLGNELFNRGNENFGGGNEAGFVGGGDQQLQQPDASGWQNDAGQADMSNASFGDYGSSGGGFGGDSGGGGGGDFGGGGGDSGGGW